VGNGSSTTVLVNSGRTVYNPIEIATTAMMIIITIKDYPLVQYAKSYGDISAGVAPYTIVISS